MTKSDQNLNMIQFKVITICRTFEKIKHLILTETRIITTISFPSYSYIAVFRVIAVFKSCNKGARFLHEL